MLKRFATLLPLFLGFALLVQANASVDHIHLDHSAEVECQFHASGNEGLEVVSLEAPAIPSRERLLVELETRATQAEILRLSSRGPPTPV